MVHTMGEEPQKLRTTLPDAPRVRLVLSLLASDVHRELILRLADRPGDTRMLADAAGCSLSTVRRGLHRLVEGGMVTVETVGGRKAYRLARGIEVWNSADGASVRVVTEAGSEITVQTASSSVHRAKNNERDGLRMWDPV